MPIKMPCKLCKNALGYSLFRELQTRCLIFNFANECRLEEELVDLNQFMYVESKKCIYIASKK